MKKQRLLFFALFLGCFFPVLQAQVQVAPYVNSQVQPLDNNGKPVSGGCLFFFAAGTSTPQATYTDSTGTVTAANPVVLDGTGRASIWLSALSYKIQFKSFGGVNCASGATIWTQDGVTWTTAGTTMSSMTSNGPMTVAQPTAATSGANQGSFNFCEQGAYWTGAASATDKWCWQDVLGTGSNPASTLTLQHTGSSGISNVSLPATILSSGAVSGLLTAQSINKVITVDGVIYSGSSALQTAILACGSVNSCTVDASNPVIGNQTLTASPFENLVPGFKLITGPYTIQFDMTAFSMTLPHDSTILGYGTTWLNSTAQSTAAQVLDSSGRQAQPSTGIFNNRVYGTTGSITTGTNTLTVASASNLRLGQAIAVLGARVLTNQQTTTNTGGNFTCTPSGTLTVTATHFGAAQAFGNPFYQDSYIQVDNEIMSYTGETGTTFTGLACGLFGTSTVAHTNGATVNQVFALVTEITGISGTTITLADNAGFTVTNAFVQAGAMNIVIDGNMVFDNNYINRTNPPTGAAPNFADGLSILLGSQEYIGPGIRFQNAAHGGVTLWATRKSYVSGHYRHIGRPPNNLGADITIFGSSTDNTVNTSSHDDGDNMIFIDDRSDTITRWGGGSNDNVVNLGGQVATTLYTTCAEADGFSSNNVIRFGHCNVGSLGFGAIFIGATAQWTTAPVPTSNHVEFAEIDSLNIAVNNSGGAANVMIGGKITGTASLSATDMLFYQLTGSQNGPRIQPGSGSTFELDGNVIVPTSLIAGGVSTPGVLGSSNINSVNVSLNSTGANFGNIENVNATTWCLGHGASRTTHGTCDLTWEGGSGGIIWSGKNTQKLTANATPISATTPGTTVFTWGALPANTNFSFTCKILYNQQTAAGGVGIAVQGATNAPTRLDAWSTIYTTNPASAAPAASQGSVQNLTTTTATAVATATPSAITTVFQAQVDGTIQVGASSSTLNILMFTGAGGDTVTPQAGSYCTLLP